MFKINKILKPRYLLVLLVLGGGALFTTLLGTSSNCVSTESGDLTLKLWEGSVYVMDNQGGKAKVVIADVDTSNGVIHAIDNVVIPE